MKSLLGAPIRIAFCLAAMATVAASAGDELEYGFLKFDVPAELGDGTTAWGINDLGVITGNFGTPAGDVDGFVFKNGKFTDVTMPESIPGINVGLGGVNNLGQSLGTFDDLVTGATHTFVRKANGKIKLLPDAAPDAGVTEGLGINDLGVIVGFYDDAAGDRHGFVLRDGVYTTYDHPEAAFTMLHSINNHNEIVGFWADFSFKRHGVRIDRNGVAHDIDVPAATNTRSTGINNRGQIIGSYDSEDGNTHGYLLDHGTFTTLDFPGSTDTRLFGINDWGVIVGTYDFFSRGLVAFPRR